MGHDGPEHFETGHADVLASPAALSNSESKPSKSLLAIPALIFCPDIRLTDTNQQFGAK